MLVKLKQYYEEIKTPTLFSLFATLCCYLSLAPMNADAGYFVCLLTCFLSYVSATMVKRNIKSVMDVVDKWWKRFLLFLLFVYFNVSVYGLVFLENDGMDGFRFDGKLYVFVALVWVIPLFFAFLSAVFKLMTVSDLNPGQLSWKWRITGFLILMMNYGVWLYAFNPCISNPDSADLFEWAHIMRTVPMPNWHPPFYAIVLSGLVRICDSVSFIIVVQCMAFAALIVSVTGYLLKIGCRPAIAASVYTILGFAFNNVMLMIALRKDIPYMISFAWLTFLLAQFIMQNCAVKMIWYIKFVLAMVFTAFFRQNGILPAIAVAVFCIGIALLKKNYRILISVVCFIVIVLIIQGPVYSFYKVVNYPGLKFFALANDIMGTFYDIEDPSEEVEKMVNEITNNNPYDYPYNSYYTIYNSGALGHYSISEFLSIYLDTFINHPKEMFKHFMRRNSILWSVVKPLEEVPGGVNYKGEEHIEAMEHQYPHRVTNKFTDVLIRISDNLTSNSLVFIIAWRTGLYTLVLLAVLLYALSKKKILCLLVFLPASFNIIALYAASGWSNYHYCWPIAVVAVFIIPFMNVYMNADQTEIQV